MDSGVVIVGGSLAGLTFALACARRGIRTQILERSHETQQRGGALGIDRALLLQTVGIDSKNGYGAETFPVLTKNRQAASWRSIYVWLHNLARQQAEITLTEGCSVFEVSQTDTDVAAITTRGERIGAQVIVGADGHRSVVRKAISPEQPYALYAGYLLWRGLILESDLPPGTNWPQNDEGTMLVTKNGHRLVGYPVAGPDGSLERGKRLLSFTWYDKGHDLLLQEARCLSPTRQVLSSLLPESIPHGVQDELRELASSLWPEPWSTVIVHAIKRGVLFATPVAEYFPERLVRGRVAVIGDAAHVASPVVGQGLIAGVLDAQVLADALKDALDRTGVDMQSALGIYESKRLIGARELVAASQRWSKAYLEGVQILPTPVLEQGNTGGQRLLFRTRQKSKN